MSKKWKIDKGNDEQVTKPANPFNWIFIPVQQYGTDFTIDSTPENLKYQKQSYLAIIPQEVYEVIKGFGIKSSANIRRILVYILESYIEMLHDVWKSRCQKNVEFQNRPEIQKSIQDAASKRRNKKNLKELQRITLATTVNTPPKQKKPPDKTNTQEILSKTLIWSYPKQRFVFYAKNQTLLTPEE